MKFGQDTRGVSEVIGAILVFGLMIALLAILQTNAVPAANEEVEYNHNSDVQSQLVDFHEAAAQTARNGDSSSTKLDMGLQYPSRMLFFSPNAPAGTLRTGDEQTLQLKNVEAEDPIVGKHMDSGPLTLKTRNLSYQGNYNEYRSAPETRYEYGVLYNNFPGSQLLVNDGGVVQGRDISLLMPAGELDESSATAKSIDPRPVSAPANPVSITGDGSGDPITLVLPSSMSTDLWAKAIDSNHVEDIQENGDGTVSIKLDPTQTYTFRAARIGVGGDTPKQTPEYLYSLDGTQFDIPQGQSRALNIEVRDEYNNPVRHEDVKFRIATGDGSINSTASSGRNGVATPRFDTPSDPQRVTVQATLNEDFSNFDKSNEEDIELDIWVTSYAGGFGTAPEITKLEYSAGCGDDDGNLIDDPIDTISGDDAIVQVDWEVQHTDNQTDLDTVDIRIIRQDNSFVGDTALYAFDDEVDGTQIESDTVGLIDKGGCGSEYVVRAFAETTGDTRDLETTETFTAS